MNILFLTMVKITSIKERGIYQDLMRNSARNSTKCMWCHLLRGVMGCLCEWLTKGMRIY